MKHFITQIRMPTEGEPQQRTESSVLIVRYGFSSGKVGMINPFWGAAAEPVRSPSVVFFFCSATRKNERGDAVVCYCGNFPFMISNLKKGSANGPELKTLARPCTQDFRPICDSSVWLHERIQNTLHVNFWRWGKWCNPHPFFFFLPLHILYTEWNCPN